MNKRVGLILCCAVAACLLYPFENEVVPEWHLGIVDAEGESAYSCEVKQYWTHRSLEFIEQWDSEVKTTDAKGFAYFPRRVERGALLRKVVLVILKVPLGDVLVGPSSFVSVRCPGRPIVHCDYIPGRPLTQQIVLPPSEPQGERSQPTPASPVAEPSTRIPPPPAPGGSQANTEDAP